MKLTLAERLERRLVRVGDCLEFQGYRLKGYGRIGVSHSKVEYAHRVAYALAHDIPLDRIGGWKITHSCDNPPCCNPKHLHIGTDATNARDAALKGRLGHPHFLRGNPEAMHAHMRKMGLARHGIIEHSEPPAGQG